KLIAAEQAWLTRPSRILRAAEMATMPSRLRQRWRAGWVRWLPPEGPRFGCNRPGNIPVREPNWTVSVLHPKLDERICLMFIGKTLAAGAVSALMFVTSVFPAGAVVMPTVKAPQISDVEQVRNHRDRDRRYYRDRDDRRGYYRGHRGSREYRRGYRRHNDGWWYPLAAFGAGAIIGGAIAAPPPQPVYRAPAYGYSNAHIQWCYNRYRSYRASDNTFQPYNGPRQQCYSPY